MTKGVCGAWCRTQVAGTKRAAENLPRNCLDRSVLQGGTELQERIRGVGFRVSDLRSGVSVYGTWSVVYGLWFVVFALFRA